jgi:hypothetical protein
MISFYIPVIPGRIIYFYRLYLELCVWEMSFFNTSLSAGAVKRG